MSEDVSDAGTVDLWCSWPGLMHDVEFRAQAELMSSDERERCGRFHFEDDRRLFVATRALVRTALSSYAPVAPRAWRFSLGARGKPFISSPHVTPPIYFNLAHAKGLVVCVVSRACELVGVDAEMIKPEKDLLSLAERYFSPSELAALQMTPISSQARLFFKYWTLKESFAKARGDGLSLSFDLFSFYFEKETIRLTLDPSLTDDASNWRFALLDAPADRVIAVAARTSGAPLQLRIREIARPKVESLGQVRIRPMCAPAEEGGGTPE